MYKPTNTRKVLMNAFALACYAQSGPIFTKHAELLDCKHSRWNIRPSAAQWHVTLKIFLCQIDTPPPPCPCLWIRASRVHLQYELN